jgi:hypothetical protein
MNSLEEIYKIKFSTVSDINEHLPTLKYYSDLCDHVTEFGVREPISTYALMFGIPKRMISYDITPVERFGVSRDYLKNIANENNIDYDFIESDTLKISIDETDLLFIDTWHEYNQLKSELSLHHSKVKKYLIFHDTTTYAEVGENNTYLGQSVQNPKGLWPAIVEFLEENTNWVIEQRFENNNGLTILKKIN